MTDISKEEKAQVISDRINGIKKQNYALEIEKTIEINADVLLNIDTSISENLLKISTLESILNEL